MLELVRTEKRELGLWRNHLNACILRNKISIFLDVFFNLLFRCSFFELYQRFASPLASPIPHLLRAFVYACLHSHSALMQMAFKNWSFCLNPPTHSQVLHSERFRCKFVYSHYYFLCMFGKWLTHNLSQPNILIIRTEQDKHS